MTIQIRSMPRIIAAAFILFGVEPAFACLCRGAQQPPCIAFQEATTIFVGKVTEIAEAPFRQGDIFHYLLIHFSVEHQYKGASTSQVTVATLAGTDCDFGFQTGEMYFVYAYKDSENNRLMTGVCTRTKRLSQAEEDIGYAQGANASAPKASILGADKYYSSPLRGSEIIVEGQGRRYETVADEKGAFKIEIAQPGKYKVTVVGPLGYTFLNHHDSWKVFSAKRRPAVEFEIEILEGRCEFVDFSEYLTVRKQ